MSRRKQQARVIVRIDRRLIPRDSLTDEERMVAIVPKKVMPGDSLVEAQAEAVRLNELAIQRDTDDIYMALKARVV